MTPTIPTLLRDLAAWLERHGLNAPSGPRSPVLRADVGWDGHMSVHVEPEAYARLATLSEKPESSPVAGDGTRRHASMVVEAVEIRAILPQLPGSAQ